MLHTIRFNPRFYSLAAMACPLFALAAVLLAPRLVPGFDLSRSLISVLALGQSRWLGALFLTLAAAALFAFAMAVSRAFPADKNTRAAGLLLCATAAGLLLLVFIDIDHVHGVWTLKRAIHWTIAGAVAASFMAACVLIVKRLKDIPARRGMYVFSIMLAVLMLAVSAVLAIEVRAGLTAMLERVILAGGGIWVEAMSFGLFRLPRPAPTIRR